jgi:hypothetical protein
MRRVQKVVEDFAKDAATEVKLRMSEGKSYDGKKYERYSDGYAKLRGRYGRRTDITDLSVTTNLRESVQSKMVEATNEHIEAKIYIVNVSGVKPPLG